MWDPKGVGEPFLRGLRPFGSYGFQEVPLSRLRSGIREDGVEDVSCVPCPVLRSRPESVPVGPEPSQEKQESDGEIVDVDGPSVETWGKDRRWTRVSVDCSDKTGTSTVMFLYSSIVPVVATGVSSSPEVGLWSSPVHAFLVVPRYSPTDQSL